MADEKLRRLILRGCMIASAVLPFALGPVAAAALLVLLPPVTEIARCKHERAAFSIAAAVLALVCWLTLPQTLAVPAALWCAACAGLSWRPEDAPARRAATWLIVSVIALTAGLILLGRHYPDGLFEGLAWDAVQYISGRKNGTALLYSMYQSGLIGLEGDMAAVPALNFFGQLIMPENVRQELMYGLRTVMTDLLTLLLPKLTVYWLGLNALAGAAVPEAMRRKDGGARMPSFERWTLPGGMGRMLVMLILLSVLTLFSTHAVAEILGGMCSAAVEMTFTVLGLSVLEWLMKQRGSSLVARRAWMAVCLLFVPMILLLLGVADQAIDLRRLRHSTDDKGGYEQ